MDLKEEGDNDKSMYMEEENVYNLRRLQKLRQIITKVAIKSRKKSKLKKNKKTRSKSMVNETNKGRKRQVMDEIVDDRESTTSFRIGYNVGYKFKKRFLIGGEKEECLNGMVTAMASPI